MHTAHIWVRDEVWMTVAGLQPADAKFLYDKFGIEVEGSFFMPARRLGRWDGKIRFFDKNGKVFLRLLPDILPFLEKWNYEIELHDERRPINVVEGRLTPLWFNEQGRAQVDIKLRPYQVEAVNIALTEGSGVVIAATGAGKCVHGDTLLNISCSNKLKELLCQENECTTTYQKLYSIALATSGQVGELEEPIPIGHFNVTVPTPTGMERAPYIVKKRAPSLTLRMVIGLDEIELICAEYHKLGTPDGSWVFAKDLQIGDGIAHRNGICVLKEILPAGVIDLYDIQVDAPHHSYYDASGILHHNTLMVAGLCDVLGLEGLRSITIVPSADLVDQTSNTFKLCGIEHGVYSGAEKNLNQPHVIATWQALQNNPVVMSDFDAVIVDEAHGAKAATIGDLITNHGKHIGYRFGFTGTWPKPETDQITLRGSLGNILYSISAADLIAMGYLAKLEIEPIEIQEKLDEDLPDYASEKAYTSRSAERLDFIADLIIDRAQTFGNTLVLVNTIKQGKQLQKLIKDSIFLEGATENEVRAEWYSAFADRDDLIVIATVGIASTGISIDRVFNLMMIDMGKSFIRAIQSIGRGLRKGHDKDSVHVVDVYSGLKWGRKHARERQKYYKDAQYPIRKVTKVKL